MHDFSLHRTILLLLSTAAYASCYTPYGLRRVRQYYAGTRQLFFVRQSVLEEGAFGRDFLIRSSDPKSPCHGRHAFLGGESSSPLAPSGVGGRRGGGRRGGGRRQRRRKTTAATALCPHLSSGRGKERARVCGHATRPDPSALLCLFLAEQPLTSCRRAPPPSNCSSRPAPSATAPSFSRCSFARITNARSSTDNAPALYHTPRAITFTLLTHHVFTT